MAHDAKENLRAKVRALPHKAGVYLMKDRLGRVIYVGKAKDLKKRVTTYFQSSRKFAWQQPKVAAMIELIFDVDVIIVKNETEALLLEGKLIKEYKPKYNTIFTDDKRFPMIKVDVGVMFPRFRVCRTRSDDRSRYFGPFVHGRFVQTVLMELRRKFGILLGDAPEPKKIQDAEDTYRLYDDIRSEIYGHANEVTPQVYRKRVDQACEFMEGKSREVLKDLEEQMKDHAQKQHYEKAAQLRDLIEALRKTVTPRRTFQKDPLKHHFTKKEDALEALRKELGLVAKPHTIECFDISHVSGTFVVASMVSFKDGVADRSGYRRYKIRSFIGNDDFRAMEEVVGRRYRRLKDEEKKFPDLIVIDGGRGQVSAAQKAFEVLGIKAPVMIGLAKREETIVRSDPDEELKLPHHHPALQLLQRVRDEAHRFANTFNAQLRSQRIRESVLDEMKGLGENRKMLLLKHFKTISALRAASEKDLLEVEGIGPLMAQKIREFLSQH